MIAGGASPYVGNALVSSFLHAEFLHVWYYWEGNNEQVKSSRDPVEGFFRQARKIARRRSNAT